MNWKWIVAALCGIVPIGTERDLPIRDLVLPVAKFEFRIPLFAKGIPVGNDPLNVEAHLARVESLNLGFSNNGAYIFSKNIMLSILARGERDLIGWRWLQLNNVGFWFGCEQNLSTSHRHIVCGRLSGVFDKEVEVQWRCMNTVTLNTSYADISPQPLSGMPLGLFDSSDGYSVGFPSFSEVPHQQRSSEEGQNRGDPGGRYLFFGGIRSPYLGVQILGIMVVGFGFTFLSVLGITRALDDLDRKRRVYGWLWLGIGTIGALACYGWAWSGNPLRPWGLG